MFIYIFDWNQEVNGKSTEGNPVYVSVFIVLASDGIQSPTFDLQRGGQTLGWWTMHMLWATGRVQKTRRYIGGIVLKNIIWDFTEKINICGEFFK